MKQFFVKHKQAAGSIMLCLVFGVVMLSFADTPFVNQILNEQPQHKDTVPMKKGSEKMTMKEFDRLSENLDNEIIGIGEEIKKINIDEIQQQVELSLKAVDMDKIMREAELALNKVNLDKIMADVKLSLKEVDWDKNNAEISAALKEAGEELEKAKIELKNINEDEIKKELENAKAELEKTRAEIKKIDIDKVMSEAKKEMANAKQELKDLKSMFTEMEKDGLISSENGFKIEYKNKELFINGNRQPHNVTEKYQKYFRQESFEIEIEKEK